MATALKDIQFSSPVLAGTTTSGATQYTLGLNDSIVAPCGYWGSLKTGCWNGGITLRLQGFADCACYAVCAGYACFASCAGYATCAYSATCAGGAGKAGSACFAYDANCAHQACYVGVLGSSGVRYHLSCAAPIASLPSGACVLYVTP